MRLSVLVAIIVFAGLPAVATAADLSGSWERSTGTSRIRFETCDSGLCGRIAWIRPGVKSRGYIGQTIFSKLVKSGATLWTGEAFNPEDGRTYQESVSVDGRVLTTKGCVLGGLICKSETWKRID
ncbi:MAG: DUF2147 domain-containing protein [Asticcacaulis sp.]|nr:DUF2147 domain-containing protein [Asticcacaulis sp.]